MWCYAIKSFWQREEVSDRSSSTGSKGIQIRSAWQRRHAADGFARNDRSPATSHWICPATLDAGIRKVCENVPRLINKLFTCLDTDDDELVTRWQQEHVIYDFNYSRLISRPHPPKKLSEWILHPLLDFDSMFEGRRIKISVIMGEFNGE